MAGDLVLATLPLPFFFFFFFLPSVVFFFSFRKIVLFFSHYFLFFSAELFIWMGDNMYSDGPNMNSKRVAYNVARDDQYYSAYGPPAEPKIPVMATWDDHDFSGNNQVRRATG